MSNTGIPGTDGIVLPELTEDGRTTVVTRPHKNDKDWPDFWADRGDDLNATPPASGISLGTPMYVHGDTSGDHSIEFRFKEPVQVRGGEAWLLTNFNKEDYASVELFASETAVVSNAGAGNCNLVPVGPYQLIVPAAGNGAYDVDLDSKVGTSSVHQASLVPASAGDGFFDYDEETNVIALNATQTGGYNLFNSEIILQRFLNHVRIRQEKDTFLGFEAKTVMPHWSWRVILHHGGPGTRSVEICFRLLMYRENSI